MTDKVWVKQKPMWKRKISKWGTWPGRKDWMHTPSMMPKDVQERTEKWLDTVFGHRGRG